MSHSGKQIKPKAKDPKGASFWTLEGSLGHGYIPEK